MLCFQYQPDCVLGGVEESIGHTFVTDNPVPHRREGKAAYDSHKNTAHISVEGIAFEDLEVPGDIHCP